MNGAAFSNLTGVLAGSLGSGDADIRGLSVIALTAIGDTSAENKIKALSDDHDSFSFYDFKAGQFATFKVSAAAEAYLKE